MQFDWRAISGPALSIATVSSALVLDRDVLNVSELAPLFVGIAVISAALGGLTPGLISALIALGFTALSELGHGLAPGQNLAGQNLAGVTALAMLAIAMSTAVASAVVLRQRMIDAQRRQRQRHDTSERLSAALDRIDIGVVLLDADTRAEFINHAFRRYFSVPDAKADSKPPFIALMYHGRDIGAFAMQEQELSDFVAERMQMVRAGDAMPINIELANREVLRFSCTALPDGGRMLSYTPVTDLVRHTDHPSEAEYYLSLRGGGNLGLAQHLRAAE
jgi:PAS domain-containing protein